MNLDGNLPIPTRPAQISSLYVPLSYFGGGDRRLDMWTEKGWKKLGGGQWLLPGLQHFISIHPAAEIHAVPCPHPHQCVRALALIICSWFFMSINGSRMCVADL